MQRFSNDLAISLDLHWKARYVSATDAKIWLQEVGGTMMSDEQARNEAHMSEVERTMFDLSGAIRYANKSIDKLRKDGAEEYLIEALKQCIVDMEAAHKRLMQGTFFHVPKKESAQTTLV